MFLEKTEMSMKIGRHQMVIDLDERRLSFVIERQNEFTAILPTATSIGRFTFNDVSFPTNRAGFPNEFVTWY